MNWLKRALQRWLEIEPRMTVSTNYATDWVVRTQTGVLPAWPGATLWMYDDQTGEYTRKQ